MRHGGSMEEKRKEKRKEDLRGIGEMTRRKGEKIMKGIMVVKGRGKGWGGEKK